MTLARLMVRRYRLLITSWSVLLVVMPAVTVTAYQSTYRTAQQQRAAVEAAQSDPAMTLLYGVLPEPGTPAQMFGWEIGAFATVLASIMAVLVAVALTRSPEDDGTLELLRSCGLHPAAPLRAALGILAGVAGVLGLGSCLSTGLAVGSVDGLTWSGAAAYGAVVGLTFLLIGTLTTVLAQVASSAPGARALTFAVLGAAFAARAYADTRDVAGLNWLSPLALRATVEPFGAERWWVLLVAAGVALAFARLAGSMQRRREHGSGLLRRAATRTTSLSARSGLGLFARLSRRSLWAWTIGVAAFGALFSAMGSPVVEQDRRGDLDGFLGSQLDTLDPLTGYFSYYGTLIGIAVCTFAVLSVQRARHDEVRGLTELVRSNGAPRWAPLAWQTTVTAAGSLLILLATAGLAAVVAPLAVEGEDVAVRAFSYAVGQWPAVLAVAGVSTLLSGVLPRGTWLAWVPLVASAVLALLGGLLGVPQWIRDLGVFGHVPDVAAGQLGMGGLLALLAVGAGAAAIGVARVVRRDIMPG